MPAKIDICKIDNSEGIRHAPDVKRFLAFLFFATSALAQQQEQKLVDRLLRPDMSLENSAQKKQFVADRARIDKQVSVNSFQFEQKTRTKSFPATREYATNDFSARAFYPGRGRSIFRVRSTSAPREIATSTSSLSGKTIKSEKTFSTRTYADQRPFLDRGKSENSKEFQRYNKPMTIDDVRELLNKNK